MMTRSRRGWSTPEDDARTLLARIEDKVRSSEIAVRHRDSLVRLRAMLEEDLVAPGEAGEFGSFRLSADAER